MLQFYSNSLKTQKITKYYKLLTIICIFASTLFGLNEISYDPAFGNVLRPAIFSLDLLLLILISLEVLFNVFQNSYKGVSGISGLLLDISFYLPFLIKESNFLEQSKLLINLSDSLQILRCCKALLILKNFTHKSNFELSFNRGFFSVISMWFLLYIVFIKALFEEEGDVASNVPLVMGVWKNSTFILMTLVALIIMRSSRTEGSERENSKGAPEVRSNPNDFNTLFGNYKANLEKIKLHSKILKIYLDKREIVLSEIDEELLAIQKYKYNQPRPDEKRDEDYITPPKSDDYMLPPMERQASPGKGFEIFNCATGISIPHSFNREREQALSTSLKAEKSVNLNLNEECFEIDFQSKSSVLKTIIEVSNESFYITGFDSYDEDCNLASHNLSGINLTFHQ